MNKEEFERLKAVCEKDGFECFEPSNIQDEPIFLIRKKKDIWDGVEFVECIQSTSPCFISGKIYLVDLNKIQVDYKKYFKPSTEQAYIDQLKKESHERFGEIKEGDRFEIGGSIELTVDYMGMGFRYYKDEDLLCFKGYHLYRQGKWATRVRERVEVKNGSEKSGEGASFSFKFHNLSERPDFWEMQEFVRSQLEDYLNK